ncbi:MAG: ATP-binding protein [Bacteroidales bacterium]
MARTFLLLNLLLFPFYLYAKEEGKPFVKNYLAQDYKAHVQNWAIIQDDRGVMYFGNTDGILEYDGVNWRLIRLASSDVARSFAKDDSGRIYVGGSNEIGILAQKPNKGMVYITLNHKIPPQYKNFNDVWETHVINNEVFFRTDNYIFKYSKDTITTWHSEKSFGQSFVLNNKLVTSISGKGLFYIDGDELVPAPESAPFKSHDILLSHSMSDSTAIIGTSKGLIKYSPFLKSKTPVVQPFESPFEEIYKKFGMASKVQQYNNLFYISTAGNGCFIVDMNGDIKHVINQAKGLQTDRIHSLYIDKQDNLWLATNNGISKVAISSPITFWDSKDGLDGNVESIIRYNDRLYAGTHQGVYYIDNGKVKKISGLNATAWDFLVYSDPLLKSEPKLLVGASNGIWMIDSTDIKPVINTSTYVYTLYKSKYYPDKIFAGTTKGLSVYSFKNGELFFEGMVEGLVDNIRSIHEDNSTEIWIGTFRNGVAKLNIKKSLFNPEISYYQEEQGLASSKNPYIFPYKNSFVIGSDGGINRYNPKTDRMEPDSTFGSQFCSGENDVFSFIPRNNGRVWISGLNNKLGDLGYLEPEDDNSFSLINEPFKQLPEMMVLAFYVEPDETAWFGGSSGLFKYDPEYTTRYKEEYNTLIRGITLPGDSIIYRGTYLNYNKKQLPDNPKQALSKISYKLNSITLTFAAQSYMNEEENLYSYILDGFESEWSSWQKNTMKEYTNLPEGEYTFYVKSKNIFGTEGQVDEFSFTILPPWYRTIWAYIAYVVSIISLMYLMLYLNSKRLKAANIELERIVWERTSELAEVNTQLEEQQAELEIKQEELTAQAEVLANKNVELKKLSIVASKTDNAVIIMDAETNFEWVNDGFTRMYNTSLDELKANRGTNLMESSLNTNISSLVKECVKHKKSTTYQNLNTLPSGEMLWIQTTLTPIFNTEGKVEKFIAIESDITKLKHAEVEIQKQRDKLEELNITKDKFFRIIAHDLRNPFNNIIGLTEFIIESLKKKDVDKALFLANMLNQTSSTAYELLENLLTWSRSQSGAIGFNPKNINLKKLLDSSVMLLASSAKLKGVTLKSNLGKVLFVYSDPNMLHTIVRNLITNAIKFSNEGDSVTLDAAYENDKVVVSVTDTGVGMSESVQEKLFRLDGNIKSQGTAKEPGTGLGLILCKEFVEKNNGKIWVESTEGKGSRFAFTLPTGNDSEPQAST